SPLVVCTAFGPPIPTNDAIADSPDKTRAAATTPSAINPALRCVLRRLVMILPPLSGQERSIAPGISLSCRAIRRDALLGLSPMRSAIAKRPVAGDLRLGLLPSPVRPVETTSSPVDATKRRLPRRLQR